MVENINYSQIKKYNNNITLFINKTSFKIEITISLKYNKIENIINFEDDLKQFLNNMWYKIIPLHLESNVNKIIELSFEENFDQIGVEIILNNIEHIYNRHLNTSLFKYIKNTYF